MYTVRADKRTLPPVVLAVGAMSHGGRHVSRLTEPACTASASIESQLGVEGKDNNLHSTSSARMSWQIAL